MSDEPLETTEEEIVEESSASLEEITAQNAALAKQVEHLTSQYKEIQSGFTKASQENAELRGQVSQINQQAAAAPVTDAYGFLNDESLVEALQNDPGQAAALMQQFAATQNSQVTEAFKAQEAYFADQLAQQQQQFAAQLHAVDPRVVQNADQMTKLAETFPGWSNMNLEQQLAIIEMQPKAEPTQPGPSRMNPPGSVGATSAHTANAAPKGLKETNPALFAALTGSGVEENRTLMPFAPAPTKNGAK